MVEFRWRGLFYPRAILAAFAFLLAPAISGTVQAVAQEVVLTGSVRDRHTTLPIASASIRIVSTDGSIVDTVQSDSNGAWSCSVTTGSASVPMLPTTFELGQNYPNPFNPSTRIPFRVPKRSLVRLSIHNILGQLIGHGEYDVAPGTYSVEWHGRGSAGVYVYSIELNGVRIARKMVQLDGGGMGGLGRLMPMGSLTTSSSRNEATTYSWVKVEAFGYEPDSALVTLVGTPRADFAIESIHDRALVFDLHNDVMEKISGSQFTYDIGIRHTVNQTDVPRMRDGGLDAQVLSIYVDPNSYTSSQYYSKAVQFIDSLASQVSRNSDQFGLATSADGMLGLNGNGKIAGVLVVEGGHCIDADLEKLKTFYAKGVRVMTITWNNSTSWAVSAQDSRSATVGLSDFGRQVIRTMDSLGMIIDISHVGQKTVEDILSIASGPVIASHSGCKALCNHYRDLSDDQIRAIAAKGGVVGVVFYPPFLASSGTVTIETVADHIDHLRDVVGVDYIALGSDFDGIERTPVGLSDVSKFPELTKVLLRRGYSREQVRKILGANFLRVFRSVCK